MGEVRLKVELLRHTPEPEEAVAMGAKLCYSAAHIDALKEATPEKRAEFIRRLVEMGHLSPIEHAIYTFGVEGVSRALLAQVTRHRIASFSVQSQRYVSQRALEDTFGYVVPPSIRELGASHVEKFEDQMRTLQRWYNEWADLLGGKGEKANEDARFVLPNACETRFILTMNARELLHFFRLRCCNRAQWEIRAMAWRMLELCLQTAPNLFAGAGPSCIGGGCAEGNLSCGQAGDVRQRHRRLAQGASI